MINVAALEQMKARFKAYFPDFVSFSEPGARYIQTEYRYKQNAVQFFKELFGAWIENASDSLSTKDLKNNFVSLLRREIPGNGEIFNLSGWRDHINFLDEVLEGEEYVAEFGILLHTLLRSAQGNDDISMQLNPLLSWLGRRGCRASTSKVIVSEILFLWNPQRFFFIKPRVFDRFLRTLGERHMGGGVFLSVEEYLRVHMIMKQLRDLLSDWSPRDMIDLQSFYWIATESGTQLSQEAEEETDDSDAVATGEGGGGIGATSEQRLQNLILYGPPGTGKTYRLKKLQQDDYTEEAMTESREELLRRLVADKPWWKVVGAILLDLGTATVPFVASHPLMRAKIALSSDKNPKTSLWTVLQERTTEECLHVKTSRRLEPQIFSKDQNSNWSLVSGADAIVPELLELLNASKKSPGTSNVTRYDFITFHQSYSYEEFVEGYRPVNPDEDEDAATVPYRLKDGIFKRICARAKADPHHNYALFIDEINRGNISKIFGELITLIEHDKRLQWIDGKWEGMTVRLPYSQEEFGVPANLIIIGTMNTADRSIAFIDIALRRRFQFREMMPEYELLPADISGVNVQALLRTINRRIEFLYDRDHVIGHSYFLKVNSLAILRDVVIHNVIPLLQEYFYGDWEKICLVLGCPHNTESGALLKPGQKPIIQAELLREQDVIGFDHIDYEDQLRHEVNPEFKSASAVDLADYFTGVVA